MKAKLFLAVLVATLAGGAQAAGCIKGAVVGGVAGHYVGKGHAVLGAMAGCAVGRHVAKMQKQEAAAKARTAAH